MYQLTCSGCGQPVQVRSFITAAQDMCPNCGKPVIGGGETPSAQQLAAGPRVPPPALSAKKKQALAGGGIGTLLGAAVVPLVGFYGGKMGPPFVGAVAGATLMSLFVLYRAGAVKGVVTGLITGDHSWFNMWMIVLLFCGIAFGMGVGLYVERMSMFLAVWGSLGGAIMGGLGGAILGPLWAELEKPRQEEELPAGSRT